MDVRIRDLLMRGNIVDHFSCLEDLLEDIDDIVDADELVEMDVTKDNDGSEDMCYMDEFDSDFCYVPDPNRVA